MPPTPILDISINQEQKYAEAAAATEKALQLNDKDYVVWANLAIAYEGLKDKEKANRRATVKSLFSNWPRLTPRAMPSCSPTWRCSTRRKSFAKRPFLAYNRRSRSPPTIPTFWRSSAKPTKTLGDRVDALQYIEKSLQKGYSLEDLKNTPDLQGLFSDPKFQAQR